MLILAWDGNPCHPEALADSLILSELHVARDLADVRKWPQRDFLGNLGLWHGPAPIFAGPECHSFPLRKAHASVRLIVMRV